MNFTSFLFSVMVSKVHYSLFSNIIKYKQKQNKNVGDNRRNTKKAVLSINNKPYLSFIYYFSILMKLRR